MRVHLVRHGETLFNVRGSLQGWCDSPLTARGRRQAEALGAHFRSIPLTRAFVSDLTRARETARAALLGHSSLVLEETSDLREWHFGGFEGLPNAEMWGPAYLALGATYGDAVSQQIARRDGVARLIDAIAAADETATAEDAAAVDARIDRVVRRIRDGRPTDEVLVVTHGAVIANLLEHLAPGAQSVPGFANGGVRTVDLDEHGGYTTSSDVLTPQMA